jgi:hypothetical protein
MQEELDIPRPDAPRPPALPAARDRSGHDREFVVLALICLLAFLVRLAYVLTLPPRIFWYDGEHYSRLAAGLVQHGVYLNERGRPSAYWPPGYPLLLAAVYALFGVNTIAVRVAQCVISAGTVALVHRIARRILDRGGARLAALVTALYPLFIYSTGAVMPVTLQVALLAGGVLLALVAAERDSTPAALAAGVLGAWATLVAGSGLPMFLLLALWMAWYREGLAGGAGGRPPGRDRRGAGARGAPRQGAGGTTSPAPRPHRMRGVWLALTCLLPFVVIIGAWTVRNQRAFGHPVLVSTNYGYNLWLGNHPGVRASTGNRPEVPAMEQEALRLWATPGTEASRDSAFSRRALQYIAADVPRFLRLSLSKALELWALYPRPLTEDRPRLSLEKLASLLSYGLLLPFALVWLFISLPKSRVAVLILLLFLTYTIVHAVIISKVRFRLPLDSFVIICGSGGVMASARALGRRWLAKPRTGPSSRTAAQGGTAWP